MFFTPVIFTFNLFLFVSINTLLIKTITEINKTSETINRDYNR